MCSRNLFIARLGQRPRQASAGILNAGKTLARGGRRLSAPDGEARHCQTRWAVASSSGLMALCHRKYALFLLFILGEKAYESDYFR